MQLDEPNVTLPLASSYNTRGIAGFTNTVTNALDQRKVNAIYDPVNNKLTGKVTFNIVKRPGNSIISGSYGASGQVGYLHETAPGSTLDASRWLFSVSVNDLRASSSTTTTVIATAAGIAPRYVDKTLISGSEVLVLQADTGAGTTQRTWYSSAIATFTEIVDAVFTGLTHKGKMEHLDGFAHILDITGRIYSSSLNTLATWPANSYIQKSINIERAFGLAKLGNQLIAFGPSTMEIFRNVGNAAGSPLESVPSMTQRYGLVQPNPTGRTHYYTVLGQNLYWYGGNPTGIYAYNGQTVEKVSTAAIDSIIISRGDPVSHIGQMRLNGHQAIVVCLDLTTATTQRALLFLPEWKEWFEWTSTVIRPVSSERSTNWLLGVGTNQHRFYQPNDGTDDWTDDGTNYDRVLQFELPPGGNQRKFMRWCGLEGTLERSACIESVQFSDDDGQTWSSARTIDRTVDKQHLYRCGSYKRRLVRLTNSSSHEGRLRNFLARIE